MSRIPRVALKEVASIDRTIVEPSQIKPGTLFVGLENIESGGRFVNVRPVEAGELASSKFAFTPSHVLYGKLRPYLAKIARPDFAGVCSTDILPIKPGQELDRGYLTWTLLAPEMIALAASRATGANLPRLSPSALEEIQIPLPPLPEQRRIAAILDKADALRAKRRAALKKLDELTQSIFLDMFGDPATNPKGWPVTRVGAVARQIRGVTYSKGEASNEPREGYLPILRAGNITDGQIMIDDLIFVPAKRVSGEQLLRKNDVLIAASSGSMDVVGKAAKVQYDMEVAFGAFCKVLRPGNEVDPTFFASFFDTQHYRRRVSKLATGININNLRSEHLDNLELPNPPRELQSLFAAKAAVIAVWRSNYRRSLSLIDALFASLQHRAFRGEL